ncbi:flp pilus-assembly TadE/G-like family protein [Corynebacterium hindlerae]|uniref:Rv3654c family TadE-like protein n=1 Tax=Corynebacterium hindlerae TaxID=699041 RepID=UPI001AD6899A|nr:Rv3654c family TadE-like protein [Corynebacterium hindlerae]QTH60076.1 flp pilus-assembly TadE/G-like family protein [Corynebacterium hindlerae]
MRLDNDDGSLTIGAAGTIAALLALALIAAAAVRTVSNTHRAQVSAELSAVAGAMALATSSVPPCEKARDTAQRNGATITDCTINDADVLVTADISGQRATARAGPL